MKLPLFHALTVISLLQIYITYATPDKKRPHTQSDQSEPAQNSCWHLRQNRINRTNNNRFRTPLPQSKQILKWEQSNIGDSLLLDYIMQKNPAAALVMLEIGANACSQYREKTALYLAIAHLPCNAEQIELVKAFVKNGANPDYRQEERFLSAREAAELLASQSDRHSINIVHAQALLAALNTTRAE